MNNMTYKEQSIRLSGLLALLKYQITRTGEFVADQSVQIFGGRGIILNNLRNYSNWNGKKNRSIPQNQ